MMSAKTILIIGASSGIGNTLAKQLLNDGANVISVSRTNPSIEGLVHHQLDITQSDLDLSFLPDAIDGLVYAPGTINLKPFHRLSIDDFKQDLEINLVGAIKVLQASFKSLKKSESASVVLFSTVASKLGMNFHSSIATSKGAIEGLGKSLAAEWSIHNVRVNIISPSLTETPLTEQLLANDHKKEASNKRHPIGRYGQSEDIAHLAQFLLSDKSSWITGQVIGVDGGVGSLKP